MIQQNVLDKFKELFGADGDIRVYFAPGRVNLIGEHTDYIIGRPAPTFVSNRYFTPRWRAIVFSSR